MLDYELLISDLICLSMSTHMHISVNTGRILSRTWMDLYYSVQEKHNRLVCDMC